VSNGASVLDAVVLGILEGLTEFIPVSSTGHLILLSTAMEFTGAKADTFSVFIQLGAILAVVFLYPRRFRALLDFSACAGFSGKHGLLKLLVTCLPAFICGALFHSYIKSLLFMAFPVACALILGGVVMILVERRNSVEHVQELEAISYRQCLGIGLFQCLALWPGISRSGSTIIGGMLLGLERKLAAEFSFLIAVPVMIAAVGYDLLRSMTFLEMSDLPVFTVGFLVSFVIAIIAIKFFLSLLVRFTLAPFGYYRIALGLLVLMWV